MNGKNERIICSLMRHVALPMAEPSKVGGRLREILHPASNRRPVARWRICLAAALTLGCLAPLAAMRRGPDTLELALLGGPTGREAEVAYLQAIIRQYGTRDLWAGKAYYMLGEAQMSAGRPADAVASFEASMRLPEPPYASSHIHVNAQHQHMYALAGANRYREAIAAADALIASRVAWSQAADLVFNARTLKPDYLMMLAVTDDKEAAARQYAAFPTDPRWTQTLADGTRVELAGVMETNGTTRTTWTPGGRLLIRVTYHQLDTLFVAEHPDRQIVRQFAVRLTYPAGRGVILSCELTGTDGGWSYPSGPVSDNGVVQTDEREISQATGGLRIIEAAFPPTLARTTLRVGVATAPDSRPHPDQWAEFRDVSLPPHGGRG